MGGSVLSTAPDSHRITTVEQLRDVIAPPSDRVEAKLWDSLDDSCIDFIARSPFLMMATADAEGNQNVSPKGDAPGFVIVEDAKTLLLPDRPGNNLAFGLLNILANPHVGLIFVIPGTSETLRVNGTAELTADPDVLERLSARGKPALVGIRVQVTQVFYHCAKAFIRSELWKPESWPEPKKISFGKILAKRLKGGDAAAEAIDRDIEEDYRTNL